jgi:hypothetical protein
MRTSKSSHTLLPDTLQVVFSRCEEYVCYQITALLQMELLTAHWHGKATGSATIVHCWQLLMMSYGYVLVCVHPATEHHQHRPEVGVSHSASIPPSLL